MQHYFKGLDELTALNLLHPLRRIICQLSYYCNIISVDTHPMTYPVKVFC